MSSKQIRILNVDDNQVQRYTTTRMLTSAGFEVVEASTAKEALSRAGSNVDLIILDVDLPDIDGFQLTRTCPASAGNGGSVRPLR